VCEYCVHGGQLVMYGSGRLEMVEAEWHFVGLVKVGQEEVEQSGILVTCVYGCCGWLVLMLVVLGNV